MRILFSLCCLLILFGGTGQSSDWLITELDNGLKVMILENHQVPQVNISTAIDVGAKNESEYFDGATHLLEHLILFRGTEKMTGEELGDAMKRHGAYFNGYTSADWTDFVISLPKENLDFALQIHADMLFRSNFPSEEMDKERQAVYEEINISEDNPVGKAYRSSLKEVYGNHPYSKNVLGTQQKILTINRDSVYAYYKRYYAPNNMSMAIVGDFDGPQTLELVKQYFGGFPRGTKPEDKYAPPPVRAEVEELVIKKDIAQAYLMMSMVGPRLDSPDQFTLDIMSNLLGSGESSRLYKRLKDDLGLVYSVGFNFYTFKYEGVMFSLAALDPANLQKAEQEINAVLDDVKQNGFTEEELQKAKNSIKTDYYIAMERGLDIADEFAQRNASYTYEYVVDYPGNIEKVTLADLNAAARKYLNTDSYVKTKVVPK